MKNQNIFLTIIDEFTGKKVSRVIDISNFTILTGFVPSVEKQKEILESWIEERGNAQNDTILTLESWAVA